MDKILVNYKDVILKLQYEMLGLDLFDEQFDKEKIVQYAVGAKFRPFTCKIQHPYKMVIMLNF